MYRVRLELFPYLSHNKKYNRTGHVFQQRYKAQLCDKERYLWQLIKYIHNNPVEAGIREGLEYKWSSHNSYITGRSNSLVDVGFILSILSESPKEAQKQYRNLMNIEIDSAPFEECHFDLESKNESGHQLIKSNRIGLDFIIDKVCKEADVSLEDVLRRSRIQKYSDVRKAIVRLCKKHSDISNKELANELNLPPSMVSKIISGKSRGTNYVDEIIRKVEEKGIIHV